MNRSIVLGLALMTFGSSVAAAFESTPRIDRRQDRQEWRIVNGIEDGSLTKREARQLRRGARQIRLMEEMALIDRKLHPAEVELLHDALNDLSDRIYEAKHNSQYHYSYQGRKSRLKERGQADEGWDRRDRNPRYGPRNLIAKDG